MRVGPAHVGLLASEAPEQQHTVGAQSDEAHCTTVDDRENDAADKERRLCLPNTRFMIHQPLGGAGGPATDIAIQAKEILRTRERIARTIAKQTGRPYDKVIVDMERDFWLSPKEAIDYGIVSRVIETHKDLN